MGTMLHPASPIVPTLSSCSVHSFKTAVVTRFQREIGGNSLSFVAFLGHRRWRVRDPDGQFDQVLQDEARLGDVRPTQQGAPLALAELQGSLQRVTVRQHKRLGGLDGCSGFSMGGS
jgi:hypothetical protein